MPTFSVRGEELAALAHGIAERLFEQALPDRLYGGGLTLDAQAWTTLPSVPGGLLVAEFGDAWLHVNLHTQTVNGNVAWPLDPTACLARLEGLAWETATFASHHAEWSHRDYASPLYLPPLGLSDGHIPFGWGVALRGRAVSALASPRLLNHGPWRTERSKDAVFIQFHALDATPEAALAQAMPGHLTLSTGWLGEAPVLSDDLTSRYFASDRSVRITWAHAHPPVPRQMLTAAALGRAHARDHRVDRVDFVFMEQAAAHAAHPGLWIRGIGARLVNDAGVEVILPAPEVKRPAWVG